MSISAIEFQKITPADEQLVEDIVTTAKTMKSGGQNYWFRENVSEAALGIFAKKALESSLAPENTKVYTKAVLSFWGKEGNITAFHEIVSMHEYSATTSGIAVKAIEIFQPEQCSYGPCLILESSNATSPPHFDSNGINIVNYFKDSIQGSLPYYPKLQTRECRYEKLLCHPRGEIEYAIKALTSKGYDVQIQPPYFMIENEGGNQSIVPHQSLSVRFPQLPTAKEFREAIAGRYTSHPESIPVRHVVTPNSTLSRAVSDTLRQIFSELTFAAQKSPLVRRYAYNILNMGNADQQEVKAILESLGYSVTLDVPFIGKGVDFSSENPTPYYKQYLYIDLPG